MSLFGKKTEPSPMMQREPREARDADPATPGRSYGVADLIRLLKTIPVDQHPDLVVRVVKTTLESVGVSSSQVIDDAARHETGLRERMTVLEGEIEGLTSEIQQRRERIAQLNSELSETIYARERLQGAENVPFAPPADGLVSRSSPADAAHHAPKPRSLPPPLPPPLHKGKPPEPATGT
jgi:hypothetical protein